MLKKIKNKIKSTLRKKTKTTINKKSPPDEKVTKKRVPKKHSLKRSKKIKDPEAKLESKRYDNPVASRTLILKTITKAGMMTQSSVYKA